MNILRQIKARITGSSTRNKLPGITCDKKSTSLEAKVVLVGDNGVGKTSLIWSSVRRVPSAVDPGFGARHEHNWTDVDTEHGSTSLHLWDTAAQEDYDRLRPLSYPDTAVLVFVFAIDDHASLTHIEEKWKVEVSTFAPGVPKVVVATKCDLRSKNEARSKSLVTTQTGIDVATRLGAWYYIECSSLEYKGIEKFLSCVADMGWQLYKHSRGPDRSTQFEPQLSVVVVEEQEVVAGNPG